MALPPKYWSGGAQEGQEVQPTWDQFLSNEQWFFVQNPAGAMADVKQWQQFAPPEIFNKYFNDTALAERRQAFLDYHPSSDPIGDFGAKLAEIGAPVFVGFLTAGAAGFGPLAGGAVAGETVAPVVAQTGGGAAELATVGETGYGLTAPIDAAAATGVTASTLNTIKNVASTLFGLKRIQNANQLADSMQTAPNLPMATQFSNSPLASYSPMEAAGATGFSSIWLIAGLVLIALFFLFRR